jgi:NDP-sugar pyrophosphorylase family protein
MILAAGLSTRLRPLTDETPKCMVEIGGRPLLAYTIEHLRMYGVCDLVINLCHRPDRVMSYFGDGRDWGVRITYSIESGEPLGTAGGLRKAAHYFDRTFLLWYGDNLSSCHLDRLWRKHRSSESAVTIALFYRDNPSTSGIVGMDTTDRILRFLEKPRPEEIFSHWVSAGVMVMEPQVIAAIPSEGRPDFGRDIFPKLLRQGERLCGYKLAADETLWWIDTPADLARVRADWQARRLI